MGAPLPGALLGMSVFFVLAVPSLVGGQPGVIFEPNVPQCETKDAGVCCYHLGSCSGPNDANCNAMIMAVDSTVAPSGTNNPSVPFAQSGCFNGACLYVLNSILVACSTTSTAAACAVCDPAFGASLRGYDCAHGFDGCCYVLTSGLNPKGFQGCSTNGDCTASATDFGDTLSYACIAGACFFVTDDGLCNPAFNACSNSKIIDTCDAISNASPGAPISNFFPATAPASAQPPGTAPGPEPGAKSPSPNPSPSPSPSPSPTPSTTPSAVPSVTPAPTAAPVAASAAAEPRVCVPHSSAADDAGVGSDSDPNRRALPITIERRCTTAPRTTEEGNVSDAPIGLLSVLARLPYMSVKRQNPAALAAPACMPPCLSSPWCDKRVSPTLGPDVLQRHRAAPACSRGACGRRRYHCCHNTHFHGNQSNRDADCDTDARSHGHAHALAITRANAATVRRRRAAHLAPASG